MISIGIDIGSISVKLALIGESQDLQNFQRIENENSLFTLIDDVSIDKPILITEYRRIKGKPLETTFNLIKEIKSVFTEISGIRITGAGAKLAGNALKTPIENDFRSVAIGVGTLYPDVRTIFEMGGDNSKYILIDQNINGSISILDYEKNGECAAGTGSFIDQQAARLKFEIEELGDIIANAEKSPTIAGRCSVFAKSDMVHAQQKGYEPPEILSGLCDAVVRNFKGSITKGKKIIPTVAFTGGVAANRGVVQAIKRIFEFSEDELFVPKYYAWLGAIGAGLIEAENSQRSDPSYNINFDLHSSVPDLNMLSMQPLSKDRVTLLRDKIKPFSFEGKQLPVNAYLGIDIGSVSSNFAVLDEMGDLIMEIYTRTSSRPIEVTRECLNKIGQELGDKIEIKGVGTTGSGRELIGKLTGSDVIKDEITAHKTGAAFIGKKLINKKP
ncbi:MAG: BadF/BadG/BcrA/BcrD ATPase family protein, partial [Spirochaetota bacterium]|nr:BadF/BadG/BcrA/BcrD ATPase family protein [Spirochaetota bacterium]